jgi:hypothetical protein
VRSLSFLDAGARHLRLSVRMLLRHKGVYLSAASFLALGIGMSVAMFSLVDAVLLRPLPFPKQESIYVMARLCLAGVVRGEKRSAAVASSWLSGALGLSGLSMGQSPPGIIAPNTAGLSAR